MELDFFCDLQQPSDTLNAQAEEVRTLSTHVAADVAKPIKGGMDEFKKAH
jgi:hypothetical protein